MTVKYECSILPRNLINHWDLDIKYSDCHDTI